MQKRRKLKVKNKKEEINYDFKGCPINTAQFSIIDKNKKKKIAPLLQYQSLKFHKTK